MMQPLRVAIVGFGIAGAATAILLRRSGHQVDLFERERHTEYPGAGILLHPTALPLVDELGVGDSVIKYGARVSRLLGESIRGRPIMNFRYCESGKRLPAIGIQRQVLLDALRIAANGDVQSMIRGAVASVDSKRGILTLLHGDVCGPYDLIVAADGAGSIVRRCVPQIVARDRLYRSAALVCLVDDPDHWSDDAVRQRFDGGLHVSAWPVGRKDSDAVHRANVSINVSIERATAWQSSGEWRHAVKRLCAPLGALLELPPNRCAVPILYSYRDVVLRTFAAGRVVFIGDAAHSMSPQLGLGTTLALQDASALAQVMAASSDRNSIPRIFDSTRREPLGKIQRASRLVTPFFQSNSRMLAAVRDVAAGPVARIPVVGNRLRTLFAQNCSASLNPRILFR